MQILFSPAKKMRRDADTLPPAGLPRYLEQADRLRAYLKELPYEELKRLLACNDAIAQLNYRRYQTMDLRRDLTPAILAYDGIAYQYMAPQVFEQAWFDYIQARVFVLSGLYGILRPLDGVVPYRLEMQTKLRTEFCRDLYDYWGGPAGPHGVRTGRRGGGSGQRRVRPRRAPLPAQGGAPGGVHPRRAGRRKGDGKRGVRQNGPGRDGALAG